MTQNQDGVFSNPSWLDGLRSQKAWPLQITAATEYFFASFDIQNNFARPAVPCSFQYFMWLLVLYLLLFFCLIFFCIHRQRSIDVLTEKKDFRNVFRTTTEILENISQEIYAKNWVRTYVHRQMWIAVLLFSQLAIRRQLCVCFAFKVSCLSDNPHVYSLLLQILCFKE